MERGSWFRISSDAPEFKDCGGYILDINEEREEAHVKVVRMSNGTFYQDLHLLICMKDGSTVEDKLINYPDIFEEFENTISFPIKMEYLIPEEDVEPFNRQQINDMLHLAVELDNKDLFNHWKEKLQEQDDKELEPFTENQIDAFLHLAINLKNQDLFEHWENKWIKRKQNH